VPPAVALRPATAADEPFLCRLFAESRADELAPLGWDAAAIAAFVQQQHRVQATAYQQAHPDASSNLVLLDGEPIGRLYVDRTADAIHVIDVTLLGAYRSRGIGTELLQGLQAEAGDRGVPVTLQALRGGRALSLYRRLGFVVTGGDEVYASLRWQLS
jgi:ribosomal protein S18 acetylase RimI-like enzyme